MRLAVGDGAPDLRRHLIVECHALSAVDLDMQHSAMHSSTMKATLTEAGPDAARVEDATSEPTPAELLIPEARQRQRSRYRRRTVLGVIVGLVVVILLVVGLSVLGTRGPSALPGHSGRAGIRKRRCRASARPARVVLYPCRRCRSTTGRLTRRVPVALCGDGRRRAAFAGCERVVQDQHRARRPCADARCLVGGRCSVPGRAASLRRSEQRPIAARARGPPALRLHGQRSASGARDDV